MLFFRSEEVPKTAIIPGFHFCSNFKNAFNYTSNYLFHTSKVITKQQKKKKTEGNTHAHPLLAGIRHAIVTDS